MHDAKYVSSSSLAQDLGFLLLLNRKNNNNNTQSSDPDEELYLSNTWT